MTKNRERKKNKRDFKKRGGVVERNMDRDHVCMGICTVLCEFRDKATSFFF